MPWGHQRVKKSSCLGLSGCMPRRPGKQRLSQRTWFLLSCPFGNCPRRLHMVLMACPLVVPKWPMCPFVRRTLSLSRGLTGMWCGMHMTSERSMVSCDGRIVGSSVIAVAVTEHTGPGARAAIDSSFLSPMAPVEGSWERTVSLSDVPTKTTPIGATSRHGASGCCLVRRLTTWTVRVRCILRALLAERWGSASCTTATL